MKRHVFAVLGILLLSSAPLFGGPGASKPPKPPKPHATVSKPPKPVSTAVSKPKAPKPVKATAVKPVKSVKPAKVTKTTVAKGSGKASITAPTDVAVSPATSTTGGTGTGTGTVPLTKVQQQLKKNTNLAAKMQSRLPAGTDLMKAAYGFKNLGQFVAAVNNSYNHQIPFNKLKRKMVNEGMSLGQAKQSLQASSTTTPAVQR